MKSIICVYLATQLILVAESRSIFDAIKPCHRSDPNLKQCALDRLNYAVSLVNNEVPGYSIPNINPYKIPILQANATFENFASATATLKNVKVTNMFKVKINDVKIDLENSIFEVNVTHPKISMENEYLLDGNILENPLHSEGFTKSKLFNTNLNFRIKFKIIERRSVNYFDIVDFKLQFIVGDASIHIISKDPEEQVLAEFLQNLFNQNARLYLDLLNPVAVETVQNQILPLIKGVLAVIPAERLLLD